MTYRKYECTPLPLPQELVVTTTLLLVVLTTVGVGSSLEYAVMTISRVYASKVEPETSVQHTLSTVLDPGDRGLSATFLSHASIARSEYEDDSAGFSVSSDGVLGEYSSALNGGLSLQLYAPH